MQNTAMMLDPLATLERSACLRALPHGALEDLAAHLERVQVAAGAAVVQEGEAPDRFYLIAEGEAEVWAARGRMPSVSPTPNPQPPTPDSRRQVLLARLGPGDSFGEMALLLGGARRATVRAATDLALYAVDGDLFSRVVDRHRGLALVLEEEMALRTVAASLGKGSPFAGLPPHGLRWLAARVRPVSFEPGQDIVRFGEPGDAFYVVQSGRVAVLARQPDGSEAPIATLGPGDPFGEQALLSGEPRSATVRALEPTVVMRLDREDFDAVLNRHGDRRDYFVRVALQRQRPRRVEGWTLERREGEGNSVLRDAAGRRYVKLSEQGALLWELMDGQHTVRDLALACFERYQVLDLEAVVDAMLQLHAAGFVEIQALGRERPGRSDRHGLLARLGAAVLPWLVRYYSLPEPDRWIGWLYRNLLHPLYAREALPALLLATLAGTALFLLYLVEGQLEMPLTLSARGVAVSVLLSVALHGIVHQLAHAATCRHFGRRVFGAGVGWYYFLPVAYVDTSDIWMAGRSARMAVALAGPGANLALAALAVLLIPLVAGTGWRLALFQFAVVGYFVGLTNLNPLADFDGYYALSDWLGVANLRSKAIAFLGSAALRLPATTGDRRLARIYSGYGVLALLYPLLVAMLLLAGYEGYLEELVGRVLPAGPTQAVGWALVPLVLCALLWRAWSEMATGARRAEEGRGAGVGS